MNYKLTIRRTTNSGKDETATYMLMHLHSTGGDDEQGLLLQDMVDQVELSNDVETIIEGDGPTRNTVSVSVEVTS